MSKLILLISLCTVIFLGYFVFEDDQVSYNVMSAEQSVEWLWANDISESNKAVLCNSYWSEPYEDVIEFSKSIVGEDSDPAALEEFYSLLNRECY